ncbi:unnamed protein product [Cyprideis torosa]|uniref:Uncharacterized protein n=1 Tax=Cyprideis torosa TaxID=163714 RepID=A0A7R8ZQ98_9CRUS|nr:unnamed protein product [Cyprideis torosa]CAG0891601.1 unnamed protein product [Cyprideis torosa]
MCLQMLRERVPDFHTTTEWDPMLPKPYMRNHQDVRPPRRPASTFGAVWKDGSFVPVKLQYEVPLQQKWRKKPIGRYKDHNYRYSYMVPASPDSALGDPYPDRSDSSDGDIQLPSRDSVFITRAETTTSSNPSFIKLLFEDKEQDPQSHVTSDLFVYPLTTSQKPLGFGLLLPPLRYRDPVSAVAVKTTRYPPEKKPEWRIPEIISEYQWIIQMSWATGVVFVALYCLIYYVCIASSSLGSLVKCLMCSQDSQPQGMVVSKTSRGHMFTFRRSRPTTATISIVTSDVTDEETGCGGSDVDMSAVPFQLESPGYEDVSLNSGVQSPQSTRSLSTPTLRPVSFSPPVSNGIQTRRLHSSASTMPNSRGSTPTSTKKGRGGARAGANGTPTARSNGTGTRRAGTPGSTYSTHFLCMQN